MSEHSQIWNRFAQQIIRVSESLSSYRIILSALTTAEGRKARDILASLEDGLSLYSDEFWETTKQSITEKDLQLAKQHEENCRFFGYRIDPVIFNNFGQGEALKAFDEACLNRSLPRNVDNTEALAEIERACLCTYAKLRYYIDNKQATPDIDEFAFLVVELLRLASRAEGYWEATLPPAHKKTEGSLKTLLEGIRTRQKVMDLLKDPKYRGMKRLPDKFYTEAKKQLPGKTKKTIQNIVSAIRNSEKSGT